MTSAHDHSESRQWVMGKESRKSRAAQFLKGAQKIKPLAQER
jgi:hypothetical protein